MCKKGEKRSAVIRLMLRLVQNEFLVNVTMQLVSFSKQDTENNYRARVMTKTIINKSILHKPSCLNLFPL